jgi:hypothetical protein
MLRDPRASRCLGDGTHVVVGTADAERRPACCDAVAVVVDGPTRLTVYLPVATSASTLANIATNGRLAIVSVSPLDHSTVQLKGRSVGVRLAGEDERPRVVASIEALAGVLAPLGLPASLARSLTHWPAFAVQVEVDAVFEQTPGPRAGELLGPS